LGAFETERSEVLYLDLEENEAFAQERLGMQLDHLGEEYAPRNFHLYNGAVPRLGDGFEDRLSAWLDDHPHTRLVAIDVLARIRRARRKNESAFDADYDGLLGIQTIAQQRGIAALVVHHDNKGAHEDARDKVNGTRGLEGVVDAMWYLKRMTGSETGTLNITGRHVEEQTLSLAFDGGIWTCTGTSTTHKAMPTKTSDQIFQVLEDKQAPLTPLDIEKCLAEHNIVLKSNTIRQQCRRMVTSGRIAQDSYGSYMLKHISPW
jgi:hypothetical protein